MTEDKTDYEYLIIGTQLPEALISASCNYHGNNCFHYDFSRKYCGLCCSLTYHELCNLLKNKEFTFEDQQNILYENNEVKSDFILPALKFHGNVETFIENNNFLNMREVFSIDLAPSFTLCNSPLIKFIFNTNVSYHIKFMHSEHIKVTNDLNEFSSILQNRGDVFKSKLSLPAKQRFMQLVRLIQSDENIDMTLAEYLGNRFSKFEKESIYAMLDITNGFNISKNKDILMFECKERIKRFVSSLGRFGDYPALYPCYGFADLPQGFIQTAASFNGTVIMNGTITVSENSFEVKDYNGSEIFKYDKMIISTEQLHYTDLDKTLGIELIESGKIFRIVLLTKTKFIEETNFSTQFSVQNDSLLENVMGIQLTNVCKCVGKEWLLYHFVMMNEHDLTVMLELIQNKIDINDSLLFSFVLNEYEIDEQTLPENVFVLNTKYCREGSFYFNQAVNLYSKLGFNSDDFAFSHKQQE
eukprot:TRINITY_DN3307_c1_g1_i1.p1 TRINITY_DN3307_c1_g1~~TRINITY_DN3307_c1_g1_i1.p1  ORF type:complete len:471 (+),score=111.80 TRINITY_DN3307_c1_g1_i1:32-1444(+)